MQLLFCDNNRIQHACLKEPNTFCSSNVSLLPIQVSNGAEVVMLSKEFLLQHFSETIGNKLKKQVSIYIMISIKHHG